MSPAVEETERSVFARVLSPRFASHSATAVLGIVLGAGLGVMVAAQVSSKPEPVPPPPPPVRIVETQKIVVDPAIATKLGELESVIAGLTQEIAVARKEHAEWLAREMKRAEEAAQQRKSPAKPKPKTATAQVAPFATTTSPASR